jgi:hypothetical protein
MRLESQLKSCTLDQVSTAYIRNGDGCRSRVCERDRQQEAYLRYLSAQGHRMSASDCPLTWACPFSFEKSIPTYCFFECPLPRASSECNVSSEGPQRAFKSWTSRLLSCSRCSFGKGEPARARAAELKKATIASLLKDGPAIS